MSLVTFRVGEERFHVGSVSGRKLHSAGCNQPFRGRFWCPGRRWFRSKPCPFVNRRECENFRRMCGAR